MVLSTIHEPRWYGPLSNDLTLMHTQYHTHTHTLILYDCLRNKTRLLSVSWNCKSFTLNLSFTSENCTRVLGPAVLMCLIFLDLTKGLWRMKACHFKPLRCFSRGGSHTNLVAFLPAGSEGWAQLPVSSSRRARGETQLAFIWTAFPRCTHRVLPLQSIQVFCFVHGYWSFDIWKAWEYWQTSEIKWHFWYLRGDLGS